MIEDTPPILRKPPSLEPAIRTGMGALMSLGLHIAFLLVFLEATSLSLRSGQAETMSVEIIAAPPTPPPAEPEAELEPLKPEPPKQQDLAPPKPAPALPKPQPPRPVAKTQPLPKPPEPQPDLRMESPETNTAVVSVPAQPAATPSPAPLPDDSLAIYGQMIWNRIAAHKPRGVRLPGTITVTFAIGWDGSLLSAEVTGSGGGSALGQAALATIHAAAPFPHPPAQASPAQLTFTVPFQFR
ncbi:putative Protein TonB [Candidatus Terasakiella magnetica]|nr:putative Protein TonB [Candidatus Terasakiella magnetica]